MIALRFNNVTKIYDLQAGRDTFLTTLRFTLGNVKRNDFFHAVRDINIEIKKGEAVGIIGRNGAGKSTLLKLAVGITYPTYGSVEVNGSIAALIGLGAGFNPDFTGRENIFLNASLLGVPRKKVEERFSEIVAFAELEDFIDVPVKRYSSGMYARLGFAIATHVDADIIVIDEVLAVGDIYFQQKCFLFLESLLQKGKTLLFVSHDVGSVRELCDSVILLEKGVNIFHGDPREGVNRYLLLQQKKDTAKDSENEIRVEPKTSTASNVDITVDNKSQEGKRKFLPRQWSDIDALDLSSSAVLIGERDVHWKGVVIYDKDGSRCNSFSMGDEAWFYYEFEVLRDILTPFAGVAIYDRKGILVHGKTTYQHGIQPRRTVGKNATIRVIQSIKLPLSPDTYTFELWLSMMEPETHEQLQHLKAEQIQAGVTKLMHISRAGSIIITPNPNNIAINNFGIVDLPGSGDLTILP